MVEAKHGSRSSRGFRWLLGTTLLAACAGSAPTVRPSVVRVRPGIEVLLADSMPLVAGRRVGVVTNLAAVDRAGRSIIDRLRADDVTIAALFAPEHGLAATAAPGEKIASGVDSATRTPIYSLYGATRRPTPEMLRGLEVLVVDLPDVGARYYTYIATAVEVMHAAAAARIPVVILDRPNPIGGMMQGNVRDADTAWASMVSRLVVPMRHGLTLGEQALLARADLAIDVDLRVVPAAGWDRRMFFEATGLPYKAPSPNLIDVDALFHYPGTCLFEGTALSVGRGTPFAFHQVGAPWLDTTAVLATMRAANLPGVAFDGVTFTPVKPGDAKFADTTLAGIRLRITDRRTYDPTRTAVHLLAAIRAAHPDQIRIGGSFDRLAGGTALREGLLAGAAPDTIVAAWEAPLAAYRARVRPFLLY